MDETPKTEQMPAAEPPREPRRLTRSTGDRMIAGVAGGLAEYFRVDPVIVRIAFAISVFFAGVGVLAYVALALFVPAKESDGTLGEAPIERSRGLAIGAGIGLVVIALSWGIFDGPDWDGGWIFSPAILLLALVAGAIAVTRRDRPSGEPRRGGLLGSILLGVFALVALSALALLAAWAGATGHGTAVAAAVVGIGVLLVVAAFVGGARWLIAPAIALALPLGAVSAADVSFGEGIGEREYRPLTPASIPAEGYELGIGHLEVDLRGLDWRERSVVPLEVDLGIGQAVVAVPSDVCVTGDADVRAGSVRFAGSEQDGVDVEVRDNLGSTATPRVELTGEVDMGELRVINDDDADLDHHGPGWDEHEDGDAGEMRAAMLSACEQPAPEPPSAPERPRAPKPPEGG